MDVTFAPAFVASNFFLFLFFHCLGKHILTSSPTKTAFLRKRERIAFSVFISLSQFDRVEFLPMSVTLDNLIKRVANLVVTHKGTTAAVVAAGAAASWYLKRQRRLNYEEKLKNRTPSTLERDVSATL